MIRLKRTVRLNVTEECSGEGLNGHAGKPALAGIGRHDTLHIVCRGVPDAATGYLINIKTIDRAARTHAAPLLGRASTGDNPLVVMRAILNALSSALPVSVEELTWNLSPYHALTMTNDSPTTALLRIRFDFSASHRLHVDGLSDDENRDAFGKCNNPNGHGHNYGVEPCVEIPTGSAHALKPAQLESLVERCILEPFDHTHLNLDTQEFGPGGLNPSVENIARVCFERLDRTIQADDAEATLRSVTVWETDRTSASYPA